MVAKWTIAAIILLAVSGGGVMLYSQKRGLRNNNPGNIRHGNSKWQGMSPQQTDSAFVQFTDAVYGIRAMAKLLKNYMRRYKLNTVRGIISRWAPSNENDTESYVQSVATRINVGPDEKIDSLPEKPLIAALVDAIIKHENGIQPYSIALIEKGVALA